MIFFSRGAPFGRRGFVIATSSQDRTLTNESLTIDATADGSAYVGTVILGDTASSLTVVFAEGCNFFSVVAESGNIHCVESISDNGIATRTYTING